MYMRTSKTVGLCRNADVSGINGVFGEVPYGTTPFRPPNVQKFVSGDSASLFGSPDII